MSRAQYFVGVDSGPMHVARAFDIPSLVLTNFGEEPFLIFSERRQIQNPSEGGDWSRYFIYEENRHYDVLHRSETDVLEAVRSFF
jgi:ADP-heptose:LPS heptosyltransferase